MKWKMCLFASLVVVPSVTVVALNPDAAAASSIPPGCTVISTTYYPQGTVIPNAAQLCAGQGSTVTPLTDTPDGYHLPAGYRTASDFTSDVYDAYVLNSNGAAISLVLEQFEETLSGGHTWKVYITNTYSYGAAFESSYDYYCGVNVSGSDPTCNTWGGNSGATAHESGTINALGTSSYSKVVYANYGSKSGKKFPMLNDKIQWPSLGVENIDDDGRWGWHVRGYDVCQTSSGASMCNGSGTGY